MNIYMYNFSRRLKILFEDLYGGNINYMSEKCQIPVKTLRRYLYEGASPSLENLWKLHEESGESFDWILGLDQGQN